ncbi:hypothetical protein ACFROC_18050 [Nocardia tengchongensis]|uniref:hypothetical protein n=1 Tax=Nocardia tengchongensis TaxID=2055889 RepID=UPI0036D1515B
MTENGITTPAPNAAPVVGWVVVVTETGRVATVHGVAVHPSPEAGQAAADQLATEMADWYGVTLDLQVRALADYVPPATVIPALAPTAADIPGLVVAYPAPRTRTTYEYALARGAWLHRDEATMTRGRAYTGYATAEDARAEAADLIDEVADHEIDGYGLTVVRRATTTTVGNWETL